MSYVGKIHRCSPPNPPTMEQWQDEIVWECSHCKQLWRPARQPDWYGFLDMQLRFFNEWVHYDGRVE